MFISGGGALMMPGCGGIVLTAGIFAPQL